MLLLAAAAALPPLGRVNAQVAPAWADSFENPTGSAQPLSAAGWSYHLGVSGADQTGNGGAAGLISERVGAQPVGDAGEARGFVFNALGPSGPGGDPYWNQVTHYLTEDVELDPATRPARFAVDLFLTQPDEVRFTARVSGRWFATKRSVQPEPVGEDAAFGDFARVASRHELGVTHAAWIPMSFRPGVTLGLDTTAVAVELPSGELEAVGLLLQPSGWEAFDNYAISAVPPADAD